jgi:HD-GYP domain-containing protein (c-di-GMP phosphodiesterase class II)
VTGVRLAEITGALSLATDLGMAAPFEHGLRRTVLTVELGRRLGLDDDALAEAYYASALMYIGCTVETSVFAGFFGDELDVREQSWPVVWGKPSELGRLMLRRLGTGHSGPARLAAAARALPSVSREVGESARGHCEVARMLSGRLGLTDAQRANFAAIYERWDGKGYPGDLGGADVPLPVRVAQVADDASTQHAAGGVAQAREVVRARSGAAFDPDAALCFCECADELFGALESASAWDVALDGEPGPRRALDAGGVDDALTAMAEFADLKSPYLLGHSTGVARLAGLAAERCGLPADEARAVRRAGHVHDVGRVAVSVTVWDKAEALTPDDWERIRLHPYHAERVLARSPFLAEVGRLATMHHERLDGSGYHRGAERSMLSPAARILAAADAYHAMTERRAYRPALAPDEAARRLRAEADADRLDGEAVAAVLAVAGHAEEAARPSNVAGLTEREREVLRLLATGAMTKQIARTLSISPKTADRHIQNIYGKIGVSTRPGATLYAVRHGLLA